jgi:hypothetical protein
MSTIYIWTDEKGLWIFYIKEGEHNITFLLPKYTKTLD